MAALRAHVVGGIDLTSSTSASVSLRPCCFVCPARTPGGLDVLVDGFRQRPSWPGLISGMLNSSAKEPMPPALEGVVDRASPSSNLRKDRSDAVVGLGHRRRNQSRGRGRRWR